MRRAQAVQFSGERGQGAAQAPTQAGHLSRAGFDHRVLATQRYLSLDEAADYLRFPSPNAFWMWAKRQDIRPCKAGRTNLYLRADLERWVETTHGGIGQDSHASQGTARASARVLNLHSGK